MKSFNNNSATRDSDMNIEHTSIHRPNDIICSLLKIHYDSIRWEMRTSKFNYWNIKYYLIMGCSCTRYSVVVCQCAMHWAFNAIFGAAFAAQRHAYLINLFWLDMIWANHTVAMYCAGCHVINSIPACKQYLFVRALDPAIQIKSN